MINWKLYYMLCGLAWVSESKTYEYLQKLACTRICTYENIPLYSISSPICVVITVVMLFDIEVSIYNYNY